MVRLIAFKVEDIEFNLNDYDSFEEYMGDEGPTDEVIDWLLSNLSNMIPSLGAKEGDILYEPSEFRGNMSFIVRVSKNENMYVEPTGEFGINPLFNDFVVDGNIVFEDYNIKTKVDLNNVTSTYKDIVREFGGAGVIFKGKDGRLYYYSILDGGDSVSLVDDYTDTIPIVDERVLGAMEGGKRKRSTRKHRKGKTTKRRKGKTTKRRTRKSKRRRV